VYDREVADSYIIKAYHVAEKLRLKELREKFTRPTIEFSNYELVVRYSEDSFLFVYNYGSAVFFNVPNDVQERELQALQPKGVLPSRVSDQFGFDVSPDVTSPGAGNTRVFFDRIVTPELSYQMVKIACMLLAESTALEYYEVLTEDLLLKANTFAKKMRKQGRRLESSEDLIQFIGLCLDTKQEIISNLYIVDSPDETWENLELDRVHKELKAMMEVDIRYRALEYKIRIIQESIEVIVELSKSRRETLLEMVIILLIAVEIVLSLFRGHS
jgi:uncharacterized Rmd1/YagE family protein